VEQHVLPESQVVEMLGLGDQGEAAPAAVEPVMPAAAEPTAPAATAPAAAAPAPAQAVADDDPIVEVYEGDAAANAMADGAMPSLGQATAGGDASLPVSGADEALMAPIADDSLPVAVHEAPEEVPGPTSDVGAAVPALHPHEAAPTDAYADTEVATHPPAAAAAPATAPAAEPMPTPAVVAAPVSSAAQPAAFEPEPSSLSAEVAAPRRGKGLWWAVGILLAAAAIGGGAYVAMNWPLP
jgi:hypothetical protein